ncbi:MAG: hypothetical protein WCO69_01620 [Candidatus Omnitrophota bacterium]
MKKTWMIVLGVMLLAGLSFGALSFAEEMKGKDKAVEEKGIKGCKTCGHDMMGGHMAKEDDEMKVVATSDGGIVIVSEGAIAKYDKDLKLVKVAQLKGGMGGMNHGMPAKKGPGCPMMKGMMKDEKAPAAEPAKK